MTKSDAKFLRIILASASPRRRQLLAEAGYKFDVIEPTIHEPETMGPDVPAEAQAEAMSYFKARSIVNEIGEGIILAADTIVAVNGDIFGKPRDVHHARRIIAELSGTKHRVITGVTLLDAATRRRLIRHAITTVTMRTLTPEQIEAYLRGDAWLGKAGAYGVQDKNDAFIERIEGSFSNVVGLPLELLGVMLGEWESREPAGTSTKERV